ncbi:hypothetical protein CVT25_010442 [Psilocybe cyanescens]|uniref:Uncharacterized protein n=1 Tax=Psilocybe cyanescens TaxID=93625 RepID=A0A409XDI7_PSICY|nr:hypothetical protein CVT25_010442 [Psilocybe cyanescens]
MLLACYALNGIANLHSVTDVRLLDADCTVIHPAPLKDSKPHFNVPNDSGAKSGLTRHPQAASIAAIAETLSMSSLQSIGVFRRCPR